MRAVLDTSVFVADEQGRQLDTSAIPEEAAVSIVTLAELELGVHLASSGQIRAARLVTLRAVQSSYESLPIDDDVASSFAQLVATARAAGRRPKVQDAWIAATALAHAAAVVTQDRDFDDFADVDVIRV
ncbi:MAG: PIN domain-containing protein [Actinobacteria bacterium]|nr:PIN domain-containing protein [Actinomycetota bacterium]